MCASVITSRRTVPREVTNMTLYSVQYTCVFRRIYKVAKCFVMSVCPSISLSVTLSIYTEQLGVRQTGFFGKILYWHFVKI